MSAETGAEKSDRSGFVRSMVWSIVLGVAGVAVFVWSMVFIASGTVRQRVRERWAAASVTPESLRERFPIETANPSALETERLARPLGLVLAPRSSDRWERAPEYRVIFGPIRRALAGYVEAHVRRDHREVDAPPAALADFLADHRGEIDALREHLVTSEEPRWEQNVDALYEAPIPNVVAQLDLHRLLCADALARAHAGDGEGARRSIEASWRLGSSLRSRPSPICQLAVVTFLRDEMGVLRQLDGLPAVWPARLRGLDMRRRVVSAMQFDSWLWTRVGESMADGAGNLMDRAAGAIFAPYVEYCFSEASDRMRAGIDRLAELPFLCDADLEARGVPTELDLPPWNMLGRMAEQNLGDVGRRLARLELDVELTAKILEASAARRVAGRWPEAIAGIETSEACPHDRWLYEVGDDGATISFPRPLRWEESGDRPPPSRFRLGP